MHNPSDRLVSLRVADVMARDVIPVQVNQSMMEAAATFRKHEISSAPVTDEAGHCVGVLSATDFLKCGFLRGDEPLQGLEDESHQLVRDSGMEPWHIEIDAADSVANHMTAAVQSIAPEESLIAAGRMMCAQHVHRLPVVDSLGHPTGIISSMDIVAALVNAVDEQQTISSKD